MAKSKVIKITDKNYPSLLKEIENAPKQLHYYGKLPEGKAIAISGSRDASPKALAAARRIGESLAKQGYVIICGLAHGVDRAACLAAIKAGGKVIGVAPRGLNAIKNEQARRKFARQVIEAGGAVVSEYPDNFKSAKPQHYLRRNEIITGLGDKTIIVAAKENSGSTATANRAIKHGRDVLVTPYVETEIKGAIKITSVSDLNEKLKTESEPKGDSEMKSERQKRNAEILNQKKEIEKLEKRHANAKTPKEKKAAKSLLDSAKERYYQSLEADRDAYLESRAKGEETDKVSYDTSEGERTKNTKAEKQKQLDKVVGGESPKSNGKKKVQMAKLDAMTGAESKDTKAKKKASPTPKSTPSAKAKKTTNAKQISLDMSDEAGHRGRTDKHGGHVDAKTGKWHSHEKPKADPKTTMDEGVKKAMKAAVEEKKQFIRDIAVGPIEAARERGGLDAAKEVAERSKRILSDRINSKNVPKPQRDDAKAMLAVVNSELDKINTESAKVLKEGRPLSQKELDAMRKQIEREGEQRRKKPTRKKVKKHSPRVDPTSPAMIKDLNSAQRASPTYLESGTTNAERDRNVLAKLTGQPEKMTAKGREAYGLDQMEKVKAVKAKREAAARKIAGKAGTKLKSILTIGIPGPEDLLDLLGEAADIRARRKFDKKHGKGMYDNIRASIRRNLERERKGLPVQF